jgi:hypothetical protein
MTTNHDPRTRIVLSWLREDAHENAERVLLRALDEVDTTPQRRSWWPAWRTNSMSTYAKLIAAAAAVLVVAVVGYQLLPGNGGIGSQPTIAPSPSPTLPSAAPSASAVFPPWYTGESSGAGILPAGSQTTKSFAPRFTFTVPQGWVNSGDEVGVYGLFPDTPANQAEFAASGGLAHELFMGPHESPYFTCDAWEDNRGGTAAEMVAAMVANEALATSEPIDVSIGGLTGKQVDVRLDPGWTDSCPGDPPTLDLGDGRTRAILLDTPDRGVIVIFIGSLHSAGHEAFLAEAMPIVESVQFDLNP